MTHLVSPEISSLSWTLPCIHTCAVFCGHREWVSSTVLNNNYSCKAYITWTKQFFCPILPRSPLLATQGSSNSAAEKLIYNYTTNSPKTFTNYWTLHLVFKMKISGKKLIILKRFENIPKTHKMPRWTRWRSFHNLRAANYSYDKFTKKSEKNQACNILN